MAVTKLPGAAAGFTSLSLGAACGARRGFPVARGGMPLEVHLLSVAGPRAQRRAAPPHLVYPLARGWEAVSQSTHLGIDPQWDTRQLFTGPGLGRSRTRTTSSPLGAPDRAGRWRPRPQVVLERRQ